MEEIDQERRGLPRREFVRVVRDGMVILMLPQVLGCRLFQSDERGPESLAQDGPQSSYHLKFLTTEEAATVEAMTSRIIPSDETAGAREARVVHFIDHMLATEYAADQPIYREGLRNLNELTETRFNRSFSNLTEADQDALLTQMERREIEDWKEAGDFFLSIRTHTIEGMFSDPKYCGNAGRVGWVLMGV